ncbi:TPA: thioredoxin-disulfide reductase [Candidatus Acetothermia bacterium]|nr:thioredoxin-disulfide reductase [Candidatus Acetothermia bacterium]
MQEGKPYNVVIIGGGPAGLTAAIYTGRALLSTLLLEKAVPGGQLNETDFIENFPGFEEKTSAPELMQQMRKQAERLGTEILLDEVTGIEPTSHNYRIKGTREEFETRSVIIATGSRPREISADGVGRLKGKGVSYCATCDGYFFQGKKILEVGAGDSGLTEALFLTKFVESVGIIVRHQRSDPHALRASPILKKRVQEHPKITFLWNKVVDKVVGEKRLTGVLLKDLTTGEVEEVKVDGLFINIGHLPETDFLQGTLNLDEHGYIITDDRLRTNLPGVFAAGDARIVTSRYAQAIIAAGDGAIAAIEAEKYLS